MDTENHRTEAVGVTAGEGEVMVNPLMEVVGVMVVAELEDMEAALVAATMDKSFNQCSAILPLQIVLVSS